MKRVLRQIRYEGRKLLRDRGNLLIGLFLSAFFIALLLFVALFWMQPNPNANESPVWSEEWLISLTEQKTHLEHIRDILEGKCENDEPLWPGYDLAEVEYRIRYLGFRIEHQSVVVFEAPWAKSRLLVDKYRDVALNVNRMFLYSDVLLYLCPLLLLFPYYVIFQSEEAAKFGKLLKNAGSNRSLSYRKIAAFFAYGTLIFLIFAAIGFVFYRPVLFFIDVREKGLGLDLSLVYLARCLLIYFCFVSALFIMASFARLPYLWRYLAFLPAIGLTVFFCFSIPSVGEAVTSPTTSFASLIQKPFLNLVAFDSFASPNSSLAYLPPLYLLLGSTVFLCLTNILPELVQVFVRARGGRVVE